MSQLLEIGENWINPDKVVSVVPFVGNKDKFFIHVDMGSWTASYEYESEPTFGWTVDSAAEAINEAGSK